MVRLKSHNLQAVALAASAALAVLFACDPITMKQKIIDKVVPEAPSDLVAQALGDDQVASVKLSWTNRADDATEIRIEFSTTAATSGFVLFTTVSPTVTEAVLSGNLLAFGTTYYIRVGAANAVGPAWSGIVVVTTLPQMTDQAAVSADYSSLAIGYATGDSATSVTGDLVLPVLGAVGGSTISWTQTSPAGTNFISASGVVSPPGDADTDVTLTATITRGTNSLQKVFVVKVRQSDAGAVALDKAALAIGYASGDTASAVSGNLTLPTAGAHGCAISWQSGAPSTVGTTGTVTRPETVGDKAVTLIATISRGAVLDQKQFTVTVRITDLGAVNVDAAALASSQPFTYGSGDSQSSVTQDFTFSTGGANGTTITMASGNQTVINTTTTAGTAKVTRPDSADATVSLTATVTRNGVTSSSHPSWNIVVIKAPITDADRVAADKAALQIAFASGDSATSVSQNVTLTTSGASGCTISWAQTNPSSPAIVSSTGTVTRQATDMTVELTATITRNLASDTKVFSLQVLQSDAGAVADAKAGLSIVYASPDTASSVTQALTLPSTVGSGGTSITWAQVSPASPVVVDSGGQVTRQASGDTAVLLRATIARNLATDTKDFNITVIQSEAGIASDLAAAKAALEISYATLDAASSVTQDVGLPSTGLNGTSVSWASDTPAVVGTAGAVTRPYADNAQVVLTATISKHGSSLAKAFTVTVIQSAAGSAADVADAKTLLSIGYNAPDSGPSSVTVDLSLALAGINGTAVSWASDNSAISSAGLVTRPFDGNAAVRLTATISKNGASDTKQFDLVVIQSVAGLVNDVAIGKSELSISFTPPDTSADSVTANVGLPTSGTNGTTVSWASDAPSVVTTSGIVTRPAAGSADTTVTLTATISKLTASDTAAFVLTVKAIPQSRLFLLSGTSWTAFAAPSMATISVAEVGTTLYAATASGSMYNYDGGWHALGSGYSLPGLVCIASWSGSLYAVASDMKIYCLDGAGWTYAGFSAPADTVSLAGAGTALYALAGNAVRSWDGGSWSSLGAPAAPVSVATRNGVLMVLAGTGYVHLYDGGWANKLPGTAPSGFTELGGGGSGLYLIAYQ